MSARCTRHCSPLSFSGNPWGLRNDSAYLDISITTAAGVTLSDNRRLSWASAARNFHSSFGTPSGTVTISTADDSIRQVADRTVTVTASLPYSSTFRATNPRPSYWYYWASQPTVASATLTVRDDDSAGLAVSKTKVQTGEDGTKEEFTVRLSSRPTAAVTVTISSNDMGEATVSPETLKFGPAADSGNNVFAWNAPQTVTVTGVDDAAADHDQGYTITVAAASSGTGGDPLYNDNNKVPNVTLSGLNLDDDSPRVSLALTAPSINESGDGNSTTVRAKLDTTSAAVTTITLTTPAGTTLSGTTLTIDAGEFDSVNADVAAHRQVTITATDNTTDAPDLVTTVSGSATNTSSLGVSGPVDVLLTIVDDDAAPTVGIDSPSVTEGNTGEADLDFTVSLSAASGKQVTVNYAVDGADAGTATSGADYEALTAGTLTFAPGETSKTVTVKVTGDTADEADETVRVTLSDPVNATLDVTKTTGVGTITDDDAAPTVGIDSPSVSEGNSGAADLDFTVSLSAASGRQVTVKYALDSTDAGTATSGTDYTAVTETTLTFAAGDTSKTVTVSVTGDVVDEPNETVKLTLSGPTNATLDATKTTGTGTITDDDAAPGVALSVAATNSTIAESGMGNSTAVSASMTGGTTSSVVTTVTVATRPGHYTAPSGANTITIAAGASSGDGTVTITAVDNDIDAADLSTMVTGSVVNTRGLASGASASANLTITDDDDAGLTVSETSVSTSEASGAARTDDFTVRLASEPTATVTVTITSSKTAEARVSPGTLRFAAVADTTTDPSNPVYKWDDPRTVTVTGVDDTTPETTQSYTITVAAASAQSGGDALYNSDTDVPNVTVSGTNADNDALTVTLSLSPASIAENGGTSQVSASLNATSTHATTVTVMSKSGVYTAPSSANTITIDAGGTTSDDRVTITAVDNDIDAADLSTTVSATADNAPAALQVPNPADVSLTITDDDDAGLTVSKTSVSTGEDGTTDDFTVQLASEPTATVTVSIASSDMNEATVSPSSILFAAAADSSDANNPVYKWNDPQTVTVTGVDDSSTGANPGYTITVSAASAQMGGDALYNSDSDVPAVEVSGTNANDEAPAVTLSLSRNEIEESAGAQASERRATVTARLGAAASEVTRITVSAAAAANAAADDFALSANRVLTIAAGDTTSSGTAVTITAVDDRVDSLVETEIIQLEGGRTRIGPAITAKLVTVSGLVTGGDGAAAPTAVTLRIKEDDLRGLVFTPALPAAMTNPVCRRRGNCPVPIYRTVNESGNGNTATFQVKLATQPTVAVAVAVSSQDEGEGRVSKSGDAAPARTTTLRFTTGNWNTNQTVTLTGVDDDAVDGDQDYQLLLNPNAAATDAYSLAPRVRAQMRTTDTDAAGLTVSETSVSTTEASGAGRTDDFTVRLDTIPSATVTVDVASSDTDEAAVSPASIKFGATADPDNSIFAWDDPQTVTVTGADDDVDDGSRTYSVTLDLSSADTNYDGLDTVSVSGTNTDDDTAGLTASKTAVSTTEASGAGRSETFTVELDTEPTATVTVAVGVTGGDTDEATVSPTSISFGATANTGANPPVYKWDDARTVTVTGADDDVDDGDRTYTVTLNPDSAAGMSGDANYRDSVATASVTGSNVDDDTAGLTLSKTAVATGEDGTTDSFTVALATEPTATVTVTIMSSDTNEATVSPGTLRFAAAADASDANNPVYKWDDARTVTVTGVDDSVDEDDKTYTITVNPDSAAGQSGDAKYRDDVATASVPGTNADDDDEPTVGIDSPSVPEGNSGETDLTFTVSLSAASGKRVTVNYALDSIDDGTATAGADYAALAAGMLTFAAGETRKTVPVRVRGDTAEESDETVRLTLSGPVNATLDVTKTTGVGTIRDDDGMGLTVSKTAVSTSEPAETDGFTVRLATAPSATVTVSVSVAGGDTDEAAVSPSSIRFGARAMPGASPPVYKWDDPRTVTVTGRDDDVDDGDRSYAIALSSSSSDAGYDNLLKTVSGTNADDDTAGLTTSKSMVLTGEDASTDTFTVRLATEPTAAVTVAVAIGGTDPDEATANPGTLTFSTMNWDTPQTVTVTGADDADADGERPYTVTLTAASTDAGYSGLSASVSGRNGDNEGAALWVSRTVVTTSEPSGTDDFTVRLATAPSAAVTVSVSVTGGDTDEAAVSPASITFGATAMPSASPPVVLWSAAQTVTVTGADDSVDDDDRSYTITVSSSSSDTNYNSLSHTVSGTNTDDEAAPTVTLSLSRGEIKEAAGAQASERRATVTARLSHATREATTLTVSAAAGANAAADDFALSANKTLTIDAGDTTSTGTAVTITAVDDRVDSLVATDGQGNAITAKLVAVSAAVSGGNGAAAPSPATLRIAEDDLRGLVFTPALPRASRRCARLRPPPGCPSLIYRTVDESGAGSTATFQVKLATQPTSAVTVAVSSADEGEGLVSQSGDAAPARTTTLRFTTGNWNTNQTVTLTGVDDSEVDDNQDYLVRLNPNAAATDAYSLAPRAQALMRTTDTNTAGLTVSETSVSTSEASGTARTDDFTVRLDTIPSATVTVDVASSAADEAGVSPASIKFGAAADPDNSIFAWNDPQTVTVTGADDDVQDGSQAYSVTLDPSSSDTNYDGLDTVSVSGTNADDDDAALTVSETSVSTGEDGTTDDFTVRLATEPTGTVTVTVTSSKTTEATVSPGTLRFAVAADTATDPANPVYKWDDPRMVTVTGVDDANPEAAQSYTITVAATSPGGGGDAIYHSNTEVPDVTVSGTNADNDAPTVTLALGSATINESGAGNSTAVSASLSTTSTHATTVRVEVSATGGYAVASPDTITIPAGQTAGDRTVTVTAEDNDVDAPDLSTTVTAEATNTSALGVSGPAAVALTITDDDAAPTASLSLSDASIAENGGTSQVSATLNRASSEDTTVTVTAVSGHYTVPSTLANRQITIDAGDTTSNDRVTITAANNMRDEANRQARVAATAVNSQGLSNTPCTTATPPVCTVTGPQLTLEDDDTGPSVTLSVGSATIAESGAGNTTTVSAALTGGTSDADTTVTIANAAGAYTAPSSANTITIAAGATNGSGTVTITAVDDTRDEPGTTTVTGSARNTRSAAAGAAVPVTGASLTVTDDDDPPVATLTAAPASIAESGTGNTAQVAATLTGTSSAATVVTVTDAGGGYTVPATANTITIAADQTSSSDRVTVTAADNSVDAADLATTVTGTAANAQATADGTTVTVTAGSLTITDDDTAALTLSKTSVTTSEDGAPASPGDPDGRDTFTVRLATEPTAAVTVALSSSDTDEATVSPASLTFTPSTPATLWSAPQTVTVTGVDDTPPDQDGLKTYTITLNPDSHATTGDANYRGLASVIVNGRNRDNEAPTVTLSLSPETISENGGAATLTAGLDGPVPEATTVTVSAAPGAGAAAGDFRLSGTTLTIPANATASENALTISAVDNRVDAPDKTVTLSATVSGGQGAAAPDPRRLTITDDEAAPAVTLAAASAAIWEDGGTTTVSARLSHASSAETRVTVRGVAELYEVVGPEVIVIPAGALTGSTTVTIRALDNTERAAADRVAVIAGAARNTHSERDGGTTTVAAARVTVWDDETASVSLLLEPERVAEGAVARVSARLTRPARAAVTLTVSAAAGTNATAASFALGPERTLTVPAGATASAGAVEIAAVDDEVDAPDRAVTITAAVASSVRARTPEPVTLSIEDDDEAPQAMLILTPATIDESGETNAATVSATLSHPSSAATTIAVSAAGTGFRQQGTTLTIPALGTASAASVTLTAVDDETHNEDREVTVSGRAENAQGVEQPAAVVLMIRDDDGTEEVTAALLPEAARAMADSRAAAVRQRLERAGSGAASASELPALTGLLERHGPSAQEEGLEWKKSLLPQASFALPLDAEGGGGGLTLWGGGDYRDLDGEAGGVKWDGEAASAHLGADRLLANGLRLGLAASWSEARFDYEHRNRKGEWDLEMTSAQPYLGWTTPGGVALWASAGYGSGELEIAPENGRRQTSDADMRMAAAGARGPLYAADGLEVSLRGEALYAKFEVDGNGAGIAAHDSDVSRLRLAVEARRERALESGAAVSPWLELGARHDGGDGATGAGAELGAGVDYASGRLELSLGARALAAHSDYDEWGADLALAYAPGADGRGLAFRLAPSWGATDSGAAELWASGAPGLHEAAPEPELGGRLEAELGYGLKSPLGRGLLTLTAGGEWGEGADAVCRLSGIAALDASASLGLELELRRPPSGGTERSLMLTGELRF